MAELPLQAQVVVIGGGNVEVPGAPSDGCDGGEILQIDRVVRYLDELQRFQPYIKGLLTDLIPNSRQALIPDFFRMHYSRTSGPWRETLFTRLLTPVNKRKTIIIQYGYFI